MTRSMFHSNSNSISSPFSCAHAMANEHTERQHGRECRPRGQHGSTVSGQQCNNTRARWPWGESGAAHRRLINKGDAHLLPRHVPIHAACGGEVERVRPEARHRG